MSLEKSEKSQRRRECRYELGVEFPLFHGGGGGGGQRPPDTSLCPRWVELRGAEEGEGEVVTREDEEL